MWALRLVIGLASRAAGGARPGDEARAHRQGPETVVAGDRHGLARRSRELRAAAGAVIDVRPIRDAEGPQTAARAADVRHADFPCKKATSQIAVRSRGVFTRSVPDLYASPEAAYQASVPLRIVAIVTWSDNDKRRGDAIFRQLWRKQIGRERPQGGGSESGKPPANEFAESLAGERGGNRLGEGTMVNETLAQTTRAAHDWGLASYLGGTM